MRPTGPSPRARGTRGQLFLARPLHRSIPARAGNPWWRPFNCRSTTVHPRARGEPYGWAVEWPNTQGPSPRARGTRAAKAELAGELDGPSPRARGTRRSRRPVRRLPWSIPARAGNPLNLAEPGHLFAGPSPRARGTPGRLPFATPAHGSIPARAGNPRAAPPNQDRSRSIPARGEPPSRSSVLVDVLDDVVPQLVHPGVRRFASGPDLRSQFDEPCFR